MATQSKMEQHIAGIIVAVILALLAWFGNTLNGLQGAVIELSTTMKVVREQLNDLKGDVELARSVPDLQRRIERLEAIVSKR